MQFFTPELFQTIGLASLPFIGGGVGAALARVANGPSKHKAPEVTATPDELTWDNTLSDGYTVQTVGGGFFRVYKLAGAIQIGRNTDYNKTLWNEKFRWVQLLRSHSVDVRFLFPRRRISVPPPPNAKGFLAEQDARWHEHLTNVWMTDIYVIVSVEGRGGLSALTQVDDTIESDLKSFGVDRIGQTHKHDPSHSPLNTFLAWLGSGEFLNMPPANDELRFRTGGFHMEWSRNGSGMTTDGITERHWAVLTVQKWPATSSELLFRSVLQIPAEITAYLRISPYPQHAATAKITYRRKQTEMVKKKGAHGVDETTANPVKRQEFLDTEKELGADIDGLVATEVCFFVSARSEEELTALKKELRTVLISHVQSVKIETEMGQRWFEGRWPGRDYWTRRWDMRTSNIADLLHMEATPAGRTHSSWGNRCLRYVPTAGARTPYALCLHETSEAQAPAHFGMLAPTGAGKTTAYQFIATGAMSAHPDLFVLALDNRLGLRIPVEALGTDGKYLIPERDLSFNPLDRTDTPQNRAEIAAVLSMMANVDPEDNEAAKTIDRGVDLMMQAPRSTRTIASTYQTAFAFGPVRDGIERWCAGSLAPYFNSPQETFNPRAYRYIAVDMTRILDNPRLASMYSFYMMRRLSTITQERPTPHIVFIDETQTIAEDPAFVKRINELLRMQRRDEGAIGMAFQEAKAVLESPIASAALTNVRTWFIWPGTFKSKEQCERFQLTEWETTFALGRAREMPARAVLLKRPYTNESVVLDFDLSALGPYLRLYMSGTRNIARMMETIKSVGLDKWQTEFINMP